MAIAKRKKTMPTATWVMNLTPGENTTYYSCFKCDFQREPKPDQLVKLNINKKHISFPGLLLTCKSHVIQ